MFPARCTGGKNWFATVRKASKQRSKELTKTHFARRTHRAFRRWQIFQRKRNVSSTARVYPVRCTADGFARVEGRKEGIAVY
jgi:hypothetical protein